MMLVTELLKKTQDVNQIIPVLQQFAEVEVKSFIGKSKLNDFYEAKGQYDTYRRGLRKEGIQRRLYLAVDTDVFESFFRKSLIAEMLEDEAVSLIVYDVSSKRIIQWMTR